MSLKYFPVKSVLLKGTLKSTSDQTVIYKLCPINEFSEGIWNLCIQSLSYSVTANRNNINDLFSVSCNVIKGQKLSVNNEVENYNQPLCMFVFNNVRNQSQRNIVYFDKQWFHINALSNELKFAVKNEDNPAFVYESQITIQVLFQRII